MTPPLTVYIAPDVTASFCAPLPAGDAAPWHAPANRIACVADWLAFRSIRAERLAPMRILAAHRLGLRVPGGMEVVAQAARECAARGQSQPWSLVLTAAAWERLQRLARLQGSPWPPPATPIPSPWPRCWRPTTTPARPRPLSAWPCPNSWPTGNLPPGSWRTCCAPRPPPWS